MPLINIDALAANEICRAPIFIRLPLPLILEVYLHDISPEYAPPYYALELLPCLFRFLYLRSAQYAH